MDCLPQTFKWINICEVWITNFNCSVILQVKNVQERSVQLQIYVNSKAINFGSKDKDIPTTRESAAAATILLVMLVTGRGGLLCEPNIFSRIESIN